MKILLTLFFLFFSFSVVADEISDFEIEGISIGDSALKFFTEKHIKKYRVDYYDDKTFTAVENDKLSFFETYDAVTFRYKTNDKEYIIAGLTGVLIFKNNVQECYLEMDQIFDDLSVMFRNAKILEKEVTSAPWDKNTLKTDIVFVLESGWVTVACYDYSKESEKDGQIDHLAVEIFNNEFVSWLRNKAYN